MRTSNRPAKSLVPILIDLSSSHIESGNVSQAERALLAASALEADAPNPIWRAEIISNRVCILIRLGHYVEAKSESERALLLIEGMPEATALVPNLLDDLASAEIYLGELTPALRHQQDAVQRWKSLLPPDHPDLIKAYSVLATAQFLCHQFKEARLSLETAISSAERSYGDHSPKFARLLQDEVIVLTRLGLKSEARIRQRQISHLPAADQAQSVIYTRAASTAQPPAR
jgi:tetratricopeptide (TPR) repeat protein